MENMMNNNSNNNVNDNSGMIAPFVSKTYQLVSNPLTDNVVAWGIHNNTFIIVDPMFFSQQVLPTYFKHNNFSSFVRQLNTYGFRKVDPDRWEFANQWFLKGQEQLLCNITRKKSSKNVTFKREHEMDEQELREEVMRLKEEQRQLEEELHRMSRRIEAVERRPDQMMTLLYNVVNDPQLLIHGTTMLDTGNKQLMLGEKKRRTEMSSGSSSSTPCSYNSTSMAVSSSNKREDEDDIGAVGVISSTNYEVACLNNNTSDSFCSLSAPAKAVAAAEVVDGGHSPPPRQIPYPFSLLEGGF